MSMSANDVIQVEISQLGYTETGNNRVKYWDDYGAGWQGQPWCVVFQWWCFMKADESMAFFAGAKKTLSSQSIPTLHFGLKSSDAA